MTINEMLNNILVEEGIEAEAEEGTEFAYYYADSKIVYTLKDNSEEANAFLSFARKNGLNEKVNAFTISFFHEVGHNETMDELDDDEFYTGNKNELSREEYYNLVEEKIATDWAIDYCNNHLDVIDKLQKMMNK